MDAFPPRKLVDPGPEVEPAANGAPHEPGVPPETNDDYEDPVDHEGADSFPASDPPAHY